MPARPDHRYSLGQRARRLLCNEMWNIGVLDQSAASVVRDGILAPPRWFPPPPAGTMLADPSCRVRTDGGMTLYAEYLDYRRGIGELWSARLDAGTDPTRAAFRPIHVPSHHVSYPFPLDGGDGRALLTAESWQDGAASLWEEAGDLRPAGTIMAGRQVVDPTLWRGTDRWWLFCTLHDVDPDGALFLFHAEALTGPWTAHPGNPVKQGRAGSRPAGPLFQAGGVLVRPGQDSSATYGGAVILYAVTRLDPDGFAEHPLRRLEPNWAEYGAGLHTLCPAGPWTLVDGKSWQPDLAGGVRKLWKRLPGRGSITGKTGGRVAGLEQGTWSEAMMCDSRDDGWFAPIRARQSQPSVAFAAYRRHSLRS